MEPLERRILAAIRREGLVSPGQRGLIAVSGGPDSMALLHLLTTLRPALEMTLEVVHFDHGLRPESAGEADWVARQAARLEVPVHIVRTAHLKGLASGVQGAARAWRLAESRRLLAQWEAQWVATGHQREDRLETWLLKWLRGAHLSHLQGMAWQTGPFIRPLLDTPRAALTGYLKARGQDWLEDPTNRQLRYKRNRVRHELLPLLNELAGGALERRLAALERQSGSLEQWLEETLAGQPCPQNDPARPPHWISTDALHALPPLAREAMLHRFVTERLPGALRHDQVERALALLISGKPEWRLALSGGRRLRRGGERLFLETAPSGDSPDPRTADIAQVEVEGIRIRHPARWRVRAALGAEGAGLALHNLPPCAVLEVRARIPGDRFHPPGSKRPRKLNEFLRAGGVPSWERDQVPLVTLAGRIIAVCPLAVAQGHHHPQSEGLPLWLEIGLESGPGTAVE